MKHLLSFATLCLLSSFLLGANWVVPDSISTIQLAIDTAATGDTVYVTKAHQNVGPVEIIDKQIILLSKNYINNKSSYSVASGTALLDTLNTDPLLTIRNADNTVIKGFLLDESSVGNGGGVLIENSSNVVLTAIYFKANNISLVNSSILDTSTVHYALDSTDISVISLNNSTIHAENMTIKNNSSASLLDLKNNAEFHVRNMANYGNSCFSYLYSLNSSYAYFDFITSYSNESSVDDWNYTSSYVMINSSILENNPPLDISQCEITYTALPGPYEGYGNLFLSPLIDTTSSTPILLSTSPCISAANPDTNGIARTDLAGNDRPDPEWAPPDMGAYESERYMLLNDDNKFYVDLGGNDTWGNGSLDYPFAGMQAAIDYAEDADTIIFKPGTYYGQATLNEKSLTISSEFILNNDSTYIDSVVLIPDSTVYSPAILALLLDTLNICGITFKNGSGRYLYNNYTVGGALYLESINSANLDYLKFEDNHADYSGGAIFALESNLNINDVDFINNTAYMGGALSLSNAVANLSNVNFNHNIASSGGAIFAKATSEVISFYTNFTQNYASSAELDSSLNKPISISQYGGAIYATNSQFRLHNSLFNKNYAVNKGPAIALRSGKFKLLQSTLINNRSNFQDIGIIYLKDLNDAGVISNSVLWNSNEYEIELTNSELENTNSCIHNSANIIVNDTLSVISNSNVYTQDPVIDSLGVLQSTSPYLNSGRTTLTYDDEYYLFNYSSDEYDGSAPGLGYLGAFPLVEFTLEEYFVAVDPVVETFNLLHAYPNPFNPTTTLEFTLKNNDNTRLDLYDLRGRHIQTLLQNYLYSGKYSYSLNASKLPSGIYICRLSQSGETLSNQKLLLVK